MEFVALDGSVSPITREAEEGFLAAQEDTVIGEGEAGAVATHGLVAKLAVFFPLCLSSWASGPKNGDVYMFLRGKNQ